MIPLKLYLFVGSGREMEFHIHTSGFCLEEDFLSRSYNDIEIPLQVRVEASCMD